MSYMGHRYYKLIHKLYCSHLGTLFMLPDHVSHTCCLHLFINVTKQLATVDHTPDHDIVYWVTRCNLLPCFSTLQFMHYSSPCLVSFAKLSLQFDGLQLHPHKCLSNAVMGLSLRCCTVLLTCRSSLWPHCTKYIMSKLL
jgi:hypothetical protein